MLDGRGEFQHVSHGQFQDLTMESIVAVFQDILSDSNTIFMGLLIFLAVGTLASSLMAAVRVRGAVKKRTAGIVNGEFPRARSSIDQVFRTLWTCSSCARIQACRWRLRPTAAGRKWGRGFRSSAPISLCQNF